MCGIDLLITRRNNEKEFRNVSNNIIRRGPDALNSICIQTEFWKIRLTGSVLHLRGQETTVQPVFNDEVVLLWNGEIYSGLNILQSESDTQALFRELVNTKNAKCFVETILSKLKGEYAVVIFDRVSNVIYYGRDYFGRRSLVLSLAQNNFHLCSVVPEEGPSTYEEVAATGLWKLDLSKQNLIPEHISWDLDGPLVTPIQRMTLSILDECNVEEMSDYDNETIRFLEESVRRRTLNIPNLNSEDMKARVALLFSGGIDSVIMASIVGRVLSQNCPVDLLNVAFENQRFLKNTKANLYDSYSSVPDRIAGLNAFEELKQLMPRDWRFIPVNVPHEEYQKYRGHVASLMRPQDTVMDLSIAIALWFAAKPTTSKVILVGMGADEQLGGYSRHRSAFESDGFPGLLAEMQMELDRISQRNLGRDDRCISDHGKESRFPFLDEDFVNFLCRLPVNVKSNPGLGKGQGEKALLRRIAKSFGFSDEVAYLPKRAIQFGAKTAKIDNLECGTSKINI